MKTFREAVEAARRRRGWTLQEVADGLGVSLATIRSWLKDPATARGARIAPPWAVLGLSAITYGRGVTERRGALLVTYEPATRGRS